MHNIFSAKKNYSSFIIFNFTFIILFISCHKSDRDADKDTTTAADAANVFTFEHGVFGQMHYVCDTLTQVNKVQSTCAVVTVSGLTYPKTITIDFGSSNCSCADGNLRRGKIIAVFSGKYRDSLTTISITTNNFYYNNNFVNLTKSIKNKGKKSNGNMWFTISSTVNVTTSDSKTISFTSNWNREWTGGESTPGNFSDDTYSITGGASGTGTHGSNFTVLIASALTASGSCSWITAGELDITPANLATRKINFGSGGCDNSADLSVSGNTTTITLP